MQTCNPEWPISFLKEATSALSNVSIDIGVIGRQGKTTETRKIAISTIKKKNPQIKSHLKKEFYVNSTEMYIVYGICMPPRIDTLSEQ